MITIKILDYYNANLLQQFTKSYIPLVTTNLVIVNKEAYFIVETVLNLDEDEISYYVIKDTVINKHRSQLTLKHLLV